MCIADLTEVKKYARDRYAYKVVNVTRNPKHFKSGLQPYVRTLQHGYPKRGNKVLTYILGRVTKKAPGSPGIFVFFNKAEALTEARYTTRALIKVKIPAGTKLRRDRNDLLKGHGVADKVLVVEVIGHPPLMRIYEGVAIIC